MPVAAVVLRNSLRGRDEDELTKLQVLPRLAACKSASEARLLEQEEGSAAERARWGLTRRGAFIGRQDVLSTLQTALAEATASRGRVDVPEPAALQPGRPVNKKHLQ